MSARIALVLALLGTGLVLASIWTSQHATETLSARLGATGAVVAWWLFVVVLLTAAN